MTETERKPKRWLIPALILLAIVCFFAARYYMSLTFASPPGNESSQAGHAPQQRKSGQLSNRIELALKGTKKRPRDAEAWKDLGLAYTESRLHQEAVKAFRSAVRLRPKFTMVWNDLCSELNQVNRPEDALKACKKALALDPKYSYAWNNEGNSYFYLAQSSTDDTKRLAWKALAIAAYNNALKCDPSYTVPKENLELLHQALGD